MRKLRNIAAAAILGVALTLPIAAANASPVTTTPPKVTFGYGYQCSGDRLVGIYYMTDGLIASVTRSARSSSGSYVEDRWNRPSGTYGKTWEVYWASPFNKVEWVRLLPTGSYHTYFATCLYGPYSIPVDPPSAE